MGNIHIKSINIETYRGIKNLNLEGFTGINIFTGDNNSGKTSVLEVLQTVGNPGSPKSWSQLGRTEKYPNPSQTVFESIKNLYSVAESEMRIAYKKVDDKNGGSSVVLKGSLNKKKVLKKDYCLEAHIDCRDEELFSESELLELHTDIIYNENPIEEFDVSNVTRFDVFAENIEKPYKEYNTVYVSPSVYNESFSDKTILILKENENQEEFLSILRIFDEDILDLVPTSREYDIPFPLKNSYQIRSKSMGKLLPLNVFGDGLKKVIQLATAIFYAKNGILLIDEFETAIHTSAMTKIYGWILKTCKKLNVQLFLTTHSKEALQKVLELNSDSELKDDITLYTLYKKNGKNIARRLSAERAIEADQNFNQELR